MNESLETIIRDTIIKRINEMPFDGLASAFADRLLQDQRIKDKLTAQAIIEVSSRIRTSDIIDGVTENVDMNDIVSQISENVDMDDVVSQVSENVDMDDIVSRMTDNLDMDNIDYKKLAKALLDEIKQA